MIRPNIVEVSTILGLFLLQRKQEFVIKDKNRRKTNE